MAKKSHQKPLTSEVPFPHKGHRVVGGGRMTHLGSHAGKGRMKKIVDAQMATGLVHGPLKASAGKRKGNSMGKPNHGKTMTKA